MLSVSAVEGVANKALFSCSDSISFSSQESIKNKQAISISAFGENLCIPNFYRTVNKRLEDLKSGAKVGWDF
jgi:hypothetical protein